MKKKAVVLLSGGLDSATTLAIVKDQGYEIFAISFNYGQRHKFELDAARNIARFFSVKKHLILNVDLSAIGGSALTDNIAVPKGRADQEMSSSVPITYVPARNTIFLSLALGWAEVIGAYDIFIGANILDYSGYPDCRPEFLAAFEKMARLGTKAGVEGNLFKIYAPLIQMTKAEIIKTGTTLGIDYSQTLSCYDPSDDGKACGICDSCLLRKKGFAEAGILDPTVYK